MSTVDIIQHSFTKGVISPLLAGRTDLEFYKKAVSQAKNVIVLPQGAICNRWGSEYIDRIAAGDIIACEYKYSYAKRFLIIFLDTVVKIYLDDVLKATLTSTVFTSSMIEDGRVKFESTTDGFIIVGDGSVPVYLLKRGVNDSTWTLDLFKFKNPPSFDFKENYSDMNFTLTGVTVGTHTLKSDTDVFDSNYVGGVFYGPGDKDTIVEGYARIKAYINAKEVTVSVVQAFSDEFEHTGSGVAGDQCVLTENAFNATYGYPTCVAFYESRLIFAATPSLPSTVLGSKINSIRDFALGSGDDTAGIVARLSESEFIQNIVGDFTFQIFTDEGEYATIQGNGQAITPSTFSVRRMGTYGSNGVKSVVVDNQTFFVRAKGSGVASFGYSGSQGSYSSLPISVFSEELISNPVCLATYKGKELTDSNYVFIVNDDGTIAVYQTLQEENISSFFLATLDDQNTDGGTAPTYKYVTAVGSDLYFIVERTIDGTAYNYIEKADFSSNYDSSIIQTYGSPTTTVTGLDHLEGLTVKVKTDGYIHLDETVSSGEITLDREASEVEVGLWSPSYVEMLPVSANLGTGSNLYSKRRVSEVITDYYETCPSALKINGVVFPEYNFHAALPYPDPNDLKTTDSYPVTNMAGWDERNKIEIYQNEPLDFTIVAICSKLGV